MADKPGDEPKIHIDSDWKEEARKEKERLVEETEEGGPGGPMPEPTFADLMDMFFAQARIGLEGLRTPDGRSIPPNLPVAKFYIDLLAVMQEKTKGNLTDDEQRLLDAAIYELRMRFVQATAAAAPGGPTPPA